MVFVCHGRAGMRILECGEGGVSLSGDINTYNTKIVQCRGQKDT